MQVEYDYDLSKKALAEERSNSVSEWPEIVWPDWKPHKQESENPEPEVPETPALWVDSASWVDSVSSWDAVSSWEEWNETKDINLDSSLRSEWQNSSEWQQAPKWPETPVNNWSEKLRSLQKTFLNF